MALNDVWVLDVSVPVERMRWAKQKTTGARPSPRGYHTANLVGNVMVVVGGSDGRQTFADVFCLNLGELGVWVLGVDVCFLSRLLTNLHPSSFALFLLSRLVFLSFF